MDNKTTPPNFAGKLLNFRPANSSFSLNVPRWMPIRHDVYSNSSCQLFPQMKPKQKKQNNSRTQHSSSPSFVVVLSSPLPHSRFIFTRFSFLIRHDETSSEFFVVNSWEREAYLMALITFQLALQQLTTTTNSLMTLGICLKQKIISFVPVFSMETKPRSFRVKL